MKRLVRSSSGRQIYGQKWQNVATSNEIESDDSLSLTETAAAPPIMAEITAAPPPTPAVTNIVTKPGGPGTWWHRRSMYQAALEGDWVAADMLLEQFPSLACDELTERGDRALHVAVAMEHEEFVQKLVERMSPSELEVLKDGHGHTACCYAAISGIVEMAELLIRKNPNVGTARDENKATPLQKAVSRGKVKMVRYLLESAKETDLLDEEWFNLLLETISLRNYGVALEILEKNGRIATMANEEGTALHLLARQHIHKLKYICYVFKYYEDQMQPNDRMLAEKLWTEIQKLGQESAVELMKKPPMLHDAAKEGNAELITMVTRAYPDLVWHADSDGYTMFHIAVIYRCESVFRLIHQIGAAMKDQIAVMQDLKGNNILHLAAKLTPIDKRKIVSMIGLEMKSELTWFEKVREIGPPSCELMKNKDGVTPWDLFKEEHRSLMRDNETWMRNTADSCLLISTIILTVVFASAFTVPGGYNGQTGVPILISKPYWFAFFTLSEAAAVFTSITAILNFWSIMKSRFGVESFRRFLPASLSNGLSRLLLSLVGTLSAIFSAYFLVYVEGRGWAEWLAGTVIVCVYAVLLIRIGIQYIHYSYIVRIPKVLSKNLSSQGEHSLFRRQGNKKKGRNPVLG